MDEEQRTRLTELGGGGIRFDCPMYEYTTFRVGGNVEALYAAQKLDELRRVISYLGRQDIPYLVVGKGSNLLVTDGGLQGVAIILQGELAAIEKSKRTPAEVRAGGGMTLGGLLAYCRGEGLSGLEFLTGIPGTVGGAVAMNAGAFGKETGDVVQDVLTVTPRGDLEAQSRSDLDFSYRRSSLAQGALVVRVTFQLRAQSPERIARRTADYLTMRKMKQPLEYPSGGSVFRNPPNGYAGKLIEGVGLKGRRIGGAMISSKHANFIVNLGGAKAADILALMNLARERVKEETGIELEPEIRVVGRSNSDLNQTSGAR